MPRNLSPLAFLALALALCGPLQAAQNPQQQPVLVEPPVYVTAIELVVDIRDTSGKLPAGLTPDNFILFEDGVERRVIGVDYLRPAAIPSPTATAPAVTASAAATASPAAAEPPAWQILLYFDLNLSDATNSYWSVRAFIEHGGLLGSHLRLSHDVAPGRVLSPRASHERSRSGVPNGSARALS